MTKSNIRIDCIQGGDDSIDFELSSEDLNAIKGGFAISPSVLAAINSLLDFYRIKIA